MMAVKFKLETGVQLLSRLTKKPSLETFYPPLLENGPYFGDFIEICSDTSPNFLLKELISEALIPLELDGVQSGSLMFVTDGNFDYNSLIEALQYKLQKKCTEKCLSISSEKMNTLLELSLKNFHLINLYDATQMYVTIQNLDTIMLKDHNISLIVFDTLTAFYWSEQNFKITKMNIYLKNLLIAIQKATKNLKVVVMYTRPQYFSTKGEEKFETNEKMTKYHIQIIHDSDNENLVCIQTHDKNTKKRCKLYNQCVIWDY